jgi:hypothetical protein
MGRGRPPKGLTHIDSVTPDPESRKRLKAVLATLLGQMTVAEACRELSLSESRFHEIRRRARAGMVGDIHIETMLQRTVRLWSKMPFSKVRCRITCLLY